MDRLYLTLLQVFLDIELNDHILNKYEKYIFINIFTFTVFSKIFSKITVVAVTDYYTGSGLNTNSLFYSKSEVQLGQGVQKGCIPFWKF